MPVYTFDIIPFPDPNAAENEGLVAIGGDLSPQMVLSAYIQGIFPWFSENEPIMWWSPNPRMVLYPNKLKISSSLKQSIKNRGFKISHDKNFKGVIKECSSVKRKNQDGTWITNEMIEAYCKLHELGFAHSVEVTLNNELVGGLYGISIGRVFFGESMFHNQRDASKIALYYLCDKLISKNFLLIDVQQSTSHLKSLGAEDITRKKFLNLLPEALSLGTSNENW